MYSQLDDNFRSSYNHSFGRRNIVNHPFEKIYVHKNIRKDLKTPIFCEKYASTYEASFGYKKQEDVNYYRRSSIISKPNLKRLHEEYLRNPVKPHKTNLTTTGTVHGKLKLPFSTSIECKQSAKNVHCPKLRDDKFFISIHENNFQKLLDIYATTNQLTYNGFFRNEKNINGKERNAEIDSKNRKSHFYITSEEKTLYRQFPKQFSQLPHSGKISTYNRDYKQIYSNNFEFNYDFPILQKIECLKISGNKELKLLKKKLINLKKIFY